MITTNFSRVPNHRVPTLWGLLFLHAILVLASAPNSSGQAQTLKFSDPDTLQTLASDSVRVVHARRVESSTIVELGSIRQGTEFSGILTSGQIPWFGYDYLGDLLWLFPGVYVRDLGSIGQYHQMNLRGVDWRSIQVLIDGRRMNDPLTGTYHLNLVSPEYVEDVEVMSGPTAAMYEFNGSGGVINVVTQKYNTVRPFTKIRYSQGGFGHLYADGVFTQNIVPRVNVVAGFQRWNLDGRYPNSHYEAWNVRFKVRWNPSNRFNLMVSDQYNNHMLGMNGGVDFINTKTENVFNEILAQLQNDESFEKINRHDLTATAGLRLFEDSTSVTLISLYYTSLFREYRDEENRTISNGIFIKSDHRSSFTGVSIRQTVPTLSGLPFQIQVGGNLDRLQVEGSPNVGRRDEPQGGAFGNLQLRWPRFRLMTFARYDRYLNRSLNAYGISVNLSLSGWISVHGGFSRSERSPTFQEQYWRDSTVTRIGDLAPEHHTLLQAGLDLQFVESLEVEATYSWRKIEDPILIRSVPGNYIFPSIDIRNGGKRIIQTIDGKFSFSVWKVALEGSGTYLVQEDDGRKAKLLPRWYLVAGIYFRKKIFRDFLDLKAGVKGRYIGQQVGTEFNPETLIYSERTGSELGPYQTVDVILIGQVGSAYLHLIWENVSDEDYMLNPGYPMLGRNVRFGINWTFLD